MPRSSSRFGRCVIWTVVGGSPSRVAGHSDDDTPEDGVTGFGLRPGTSVHPTGAEDDAGRCDRGAPPRQPPVTGGRVRLPVDHPRLPAAHPQLLRDEASLPRCESQLQADHLQLHAMNKRMQGDKGQLQADHLQLQAMNKPMQGDKGQLQADHPQLQAMRKPMQADHLQLHAMNKPMQGDQGQLQADHLQLRGDKHAVQGQEHQLQAYHRHLQARHVTDAGPLAMTGNPETSMPRRRRAERRELLVEAHVQGPHTTVWAAAESISIPRKPAVPPVSHAAPVWDPENPRNQLPLRQHVEQLLDCR